MAYNLVAYDQSQQYLMPPSIKDWVRPESMARMVNDVVDLLESEGKLAAFYAELRLDGRGAWSYHPRMLLKVLLFSYCFGVTSSRKIASSLHNDIALRYLAANNTPDFRTLSDFRKRHLERFQALFVDVLRLCQEAGLVRLGRVALDGRKVAGNAALKQNRSKEALAKEIDELLAEAERVDAEEDAKPPTDGDTLPKNLRGAEERLERLQAAHARLLAQEKSAQDEQARKLEQRAQEEQASGHKKRGRKPKPPEEVAQPERKANTTDPDSRILRTRTAWKQGFNAQAAADADCQIIVAADVTQDENDVKQLAPMLARIEEQAGARPKQLLADAGYFSEANLGEGKDTELFIATKKDAKRRAELRTMRPPKGRIPKAATAKERMERKLRTKAGREVYQLRSTTIEPVFGQMVMRGLTQFRLRGLAKVKGEWALWCATHNLLKLWRSGWTR
mgnify:CR=1 FL=1